MRTLPRLAWRNVWRNPRRTGLTLAATVFAVVLVVFFVAMSAGLHEKMIEDSVRLRSGHLTLMGDGYLERRTLEQYLDYRPGLVEALASDPAVEGFAPRLVGFGLLSQDSSTRGVAVLGVDPDREPSVSSLSRRVAQGRFLDGQGTREIVLGQKLAQTLSADLGDEVLLYSIAYSLEMAYDLFRVVGIVRLPDANLERQLAILDLSVAQAFFVYGDRVSEVAVLTRGADRVVELRDRLAGQLDGGVEVHTWREVMPELVQLIVLDDAGMYIMLVILVVVVAFGILNTVLMSVLERTREFGVVLALGLAPSALFRLIYLESLLLAGVGLVVGLGIAIPLVLWFVAHPIELAGTQMGGAIELLGFEPVLTWKLKPLNPIGSTLTIFGVAALAALYPAYKASRSRPVDALRSL